MDKQLLNALDNLSLALEMIVESLNKEKSEAKSDVGSALQSGDFGKQLEEINKGIKEINSDTKKILDDTQTIIKLQKEQKDQKTSEIEGAGSERGKKIKDGVTMIVLMAGAILAMGLAFKLIGAVDWKSVLAISIALPMIAFAFEKIGEMKKVTLSQMIGLIGITVAMATAITLSSWVLNKVVPIGLFQAMTVVFIAVAFGAAAFGLGQLLMAFKDIKAADALKASIVLPIVLLAVSIAIALSSHVLGYVKPVGIFQLITIVLIAAAFGVISMGLGKLLSSFKDISTGDAVAAATLMPIILIALSLAIMISSQILQGVVPIGIWQAVTSIFIAATFVVLAYAVKPLMEGTKGVDYEDILKGTLILIALAAAITTASWIVSFMAPVSFGQLLGFVLVGIAVAVTSVVMALAFKAVNLLGTPDKYIEGGISILIIATTIALSSLILSIGDYKNYPDWKWSLGVAMSLGAFGLGAVLLGTQSFNPFFYMGLGVILVVAGTIVATSYILGLGSYEKYPSLEWATSISLLIGSFSIVAVAAAIASPLISLGLVVMTSIVGTIYLIDLIFSSGKYNKYPDNGWINSSALVIAKFAAMSILYALILPVITAGVTSILLMAGTIYTIDRIFSNGEFVKFPTDIWINGVSNTIKKMADFAVYIRKNIGFADLIIGALKMLGVVGTIKLIDDILDKGSFKRHPSMEWTDGVVHSILGFIGLMDSKGFLDVIGEKFGSFFGGGLDDIANIIIKIDKIFAKGNFSKFPSYGWSFGVAGTIKIFNDIISSGGFFGNLFGKKKSILTDLAYMALSVDKIFSFGDFTKYPKMEWVNGVSYAMTKFKTILKSLNFDDISGGGFIGRIGSILGMSNPLKEAVSNITLLAQAFDKLGKAMNTFSNSIQSLDADKLSAIRSLSSNVILMSLMDPDQFDKMMDKLEERSSIFGDLIKDFESKKSEVTTSSSVRVISGSGPKGKSDSQILGEKVDRMTAILADISSVVGSSGTLKTYLNSIKETQLSTSTSYNRSDRRLKNILKKIGVSDDGINIYLFTYNFDKNSIYQGVIAQELLGTKFENATLIDKNGIYSVDYSKIDVEFKKVETSKV